MTTRLLPILTIVLLLCGCANQQHRPVPAPPELRKVADDFLHAIARGERAGLARFVVDKSSFTEPDLAVGTYEYIYGKGGLQDIIKLGGITYRIDMAKDGHSAVVFYYPRRYAKQVAQDPDFLERTYLHKNFACEFTHLPEGWIIEVGFCFFESDALFFKGSDYY